MGEGGGNNLCSAVKTPQTVNRRQRGSFTKKYASLFIDGTKSARAESTGSETLERQQEAGRKSDRVKRRRKFPKFVISDACYWFKQSAHYDT